MNVIRYETKAESLVLDCLQLFGTVPYDMMERYLKYRIPNPKFYPKITLTELVQDKVIYYDSKDKCYRCIQNYPKDIDRIASFAVFLAFSKSQEVKLAKSKYPFDFIFEENKIAYQIIDFSRAGLYKLNFRRQMDMGLLNNDEYKIVPIIQLLNTGCDVLKEYDEKGRLFLLPEEDFYIAYVTYIPKVGDLDEITVEKVRYKGGTLDEY